MEVLIGNAWQLPHQGEGLRFEASQPHGYRNLSSKIAIIHDTIHYSNDGMPSTGLIASSGNVVPDAMGQ
jgi:hypothetical protein